MTKKYKEIDQLAERITAHLKRFEFDAITNAISPEYGTCDYYYAHASRAYGPSIIVRYIAYQMEHRLTIDEATRYLAWLDAGNVGKHWEALKDGGEE